MFELRETAIDPREVIAAVSHPSCGAIDVFVGVVRDHAEGRAVSALEYVAYASMAEAELARVAAEIGARVPGVRLAALHRVGRLAVGDVAVVCAAAAPHRAEAFEACRLLIEGIKARAPIWKRETGPDGVTWVGAEAITRPRPEG